MSSPLECPPSLKQIQHYLKVASEHETRNPVVCYWSQFYALQTAIPHKANDNKSFLLAMMDHLEMKKKELSDNEAITNDVVAQAHIENYALKLFAWADTQDRQANFGKNVVKAFYTAGMLFDVLTIFGELSEEVQQNRKYAKWKAAYIHNCLKNGERPVPGPMKGDDEDNEFAAPHSDDGPGDPPQNLIPPVSPSLGFQAPSDPSLLPQPFQPPLPSLPAFNPSESPSLPPFQQFPQPPFQPPMQPTRDFPEQPSPHAGGYPSAGVTNFVQPQPLPSAVPSSLELPGQTDLKLSAEQMTKAQKYCKYAGSALNYDDVPTAISFLEKALRLCKTGVDS